MKNMTIPTNILDHQKKTGQDASIERIARAWDSTVRRELYRLARISWPDLFWMGLVPMHGWRLRKQITRGRAEWWIERDFQPYDRFRCEAYRVELGAGQRGEASWRVYSGSGAYLVMPMSADALRTALLRAIGDPPLIIQRKFGPAVDP